MKTLYKQLLIAVIINNLLFGVAFARATISVAELALPSDVKHILKRSGSVYYSPSMRDKALVPVNFWGEVGNTGLHFIPAGTSLVRGLSLAGGPTSHARLKKIRISRLDPATGAMKEYEFNLSRGGGKLAHGHLLKHGDTVFVERSRFYQDRSYYTSLVGVLATLLSAVFIYQKIKD